MGDVIVNADDFGLVREVNAAVIEAHQAGTVTSATLMPNGEAVAEAARLALANPDLGVGLHFTLTYGAPVADPARSLVDREGRFRSRRDLLRRAWSRELRLSDVDRELRAQIRRLRELGIEPTHVDGHQHVQVFPVVAAAVTAVAREMRLPVRVPVVGWRLDAGFSRLAQRLSLAALCASARRGGLRPATAAFASVFDLGPPRHIDGAVYARLIERARRTTLELMVHPAFASPRLEEIHPDLYRLALAEAAALRDPALAGELRAKGARLVSFRQLRSGA